MKKVVVIGGGIAGISFIKEIEKNNNKEIDIMLIEPKDYMEVPYGMLRALVDPKGYGPKVRKKISEIIKSKHIQSKVVELKDNEVHLDTGEVVEFDYAVVATGSSAKGFTDLKVRNQQNIETRTKQWEKYAQDLKKAKKVAIIGGGTVGVELAGEIAESYSEKEVVVYQRGNRLLTHLPVKASNKAYKVLSDLGVKIILNSNVTCLEDNDIFMVRDLIGNEQKYDRVYKSFGNHYETEFIKGNATNLLDKQNQIVVNDFLQLKKRTHIWAIGDINNVPEIKLGTLAIKQAKQTAINLIRLNSRKPLKKYKPFRGALSFITLGRKNGIAQLPFGRLDFLAMYKQKKDLFVTDILEPINKEKR